jgi:hypothetical protein
LVGALDRPHSIALAYQTSTIAAGGEEIVVMKTGALSEKARAQRRGPYGIARVGPLAPQEMNENRCEHERSDRARDPQETSYRRRYFVKPM